MLSRSLPHCSCNIVPRSFSSLRSAYKRWNLPESHNPYTAPPVRCLPVLLSSLRISSRPCDGHRTNLYCIDKVINCSMLITDIAPMLKDNFYPIRRGCIVNSIYVTAIRRCELELIFGTVISIPVPSYTKVKKELQKIITE